MEKEQIVILENRGLISISGEDKSEFLQNILSNDVNKVNYSNSIFSAIFTPQGKYLYEFFVIQSKNGYFLDCDNDVTEELIDYLSKYKLKSKVEIKNFSSEYVIGVISLEKFKDIQTNEKNNSDTIIYRESTIFVDCRTKKLGARILSNLEKLHLTIKKLDLKIISIKNYLNRAHLCGIPIQGVSNLQNQLFGLEANFEELCAIDFKKGCYVGQENTARMKLKNKIRRKLFPIKCEKELTISTEIFFKNKNIGKILIAKPYPFALIKLFDPDLSDLMESDLICGNLNIKILNPLVDC